jgi:D-glycero-beta-D-manno-heptose-7-phosphate kinase
MLTPQQVLRIDRPPTEVPSAVGIARLADELARADVDAVLYSDYGYFDLAAYSAADRVLRERGVVRVLDPRLAPGPFEHLDALTPNLDDFEAALASVGAATHRDAGDLAARAGRARERFCVRELLVTLGNRGMLLASVDGAWHVPPTGRAGVVDVSGAGDTAAAVFTAAIALGQPAPVAMALANTAAGDVVMISGTVPVDLERLRAAWPAAPRARALERSTAFDVASRPDGGEL